MAARGGNSSNVDQRAKEAILKTKVRELEEEVVQLKQRLDDLRKAKNTTIHKREREVIHVATPFGRRDSKTDMKKSTSENSVRKDDKDIDKLKKTFAEEMDALKNQMAKESKRGHDPELALLRRQLSEVEGDNGALRVDNQQLSERVENLSMQLTLKEASWCAAEEKLKLELQRSWGEKYREWMSTTEDKIDELQRTNALLRGYLKNQKPTGQDPSRVENDGI